MEPKGNNSLRWFTQQKHYYKISFLYLCFVNNVFSNDYILFPHLLYRISCCLFFTILQDLAVRATEKLNAVRVLVTHLQTIKIASIFLFNLCK